MVNGKLETKNADRVFLSSTRIFDLSNAQPLIYKTAWFTSSEESAALILQRYREINKYVTLYT